MKIRELLHLFLGGYDNTLSVERPIDPQTPNEVLFKDRYTTGLVPREIEEMDFFSFSVNSERRELKADIVIYVK